MNIYLIYQDVCYEDGKVYFAVFNNKKDAENYIETHKKFNFHIKECKNGEEL